MSGYQELVTLVRFRPLTRPLPGPSYGGSTTSPFSASWSSTVELLARELNAVGARQAVLEVDMREQDFRIDGLPRANARAATPAVALSFQATKVPGKPALRYEVGTYWDWQDNVRAIALGLQALRAVDRYGVTKRGEQYAGWKALPAGTDDGPNPVRGADLVEQHGSIKAALMATHPDRGGNERDFRDVQAFREQEAA